jgi:hypothetical protein
MINSAKQSILLKESEVDCLAADFIIGRASARPVGSSQ